jgi:hypothetical protein
MRGVSALKRILRLSQLILLPHVDVSLRMGCLDQ